MVKKPYRFLEHTADYMLEVTGTSKEKLFINIAYALADLMYDIKTVQAKNTQIFSFKGDNIEEMIKNFISCIIRLVCGSYFLFNKVSINIKNSKMEGECKAKGEPIDKSRHQLRKEVKAITEHNFKVEKIGRIRKVIFVVDV